MSDIFVGALLVDDTNEGEKEKKEEKTRQRRKARKSPSLDEMNKSVDLGALIDSDDDSDEEDIETARERLGRSMPELGPIVAKQKMSRRRSKEQLSIGEDEEFQYQALGDDPSRHGVEDKTVEDIFTFYSWSTSRQPRDEIENGRRRLRDSVRDDAMNAALESLMKAYNRQ